MNLTHFSPKHDAGISDGLPCSVCGHLAKDTDVLFTVNDTTEYQEEWIRKIWNKDPHTEFMVCEGCLDGHRGKEPGLTADEWLEEKNEQFEAQRA